MYPNQLVAERTNAIPCQYKGINFRSLLEARWAYFFDKLGWTWQYEPFEMDGYIPDFLVNANFHDLNHSRKIVVDVKPFFTKDYQNEVIKKCNQYREHYSLLFASTPTIKIYNTSTNGCEECKTKIKYYNLGDVSCLDKRPIANLCVYALKKIFYTSPMLFEDYLREQAVKEKTLREGDYEVIFAYYTDMIIDDDNKTIDYLYMNIAPRASIACSHYNTKISQLESYWAEAQNATQYKSQEPKQFIENI